MPYELNQQSQINRKNFFHEYLLHAGVNGNKTQRSGQTQGLHTILTKEVMFGLQVTINNGEVTMKCMEGVMECRLF